jgi:hypothetical protein
LDFIGGLIDIGGIASCFNKLLGDEVHELDFFTKFHSMTPGLRQEIFILSDFIFELFHHLIEFYL